MANPVATNVKEVFAAMPTRFNAGVAKGLKAVYQFDLTGDNGGKCSLAIDDGKLTVGEGTHASPNITLRVYGHLIHGADDRAAQIMDAAFGSKMVADTGKRTGNQR